MAQTQTAPVLDALTGEGSVPSTYEHFEKEITPAEGIDLGKT